jgi:acyl carrier protein
MDVEGRVRRILAEKLRIDPSKVKPESLLVEDLGADSLDVVEVVMKLEEEFGISIPDSDVEGIRTVADVVEYIRTKTEAS